MSSPRALANQYLYQARILASSWRKEVAAHEVAVSVLADTFVPAASGKLLQAYGWFLLEIMPPATLPDAPPLRCSDLPEVAPGKAVPGEIREFMQLEAQGWIGDILHAASPRSVRSGSSRGNLAQPAADVSVDPDTIDNWIDRLQDIFSRMSESLDEY
ncbi:MAG: hypothetical protein V7746_05645 [Halioglobus sp.]